MKIKKTKKQLYFPYSLNHKQREYDVQINWRQNTYIPEFGKSVFTRQI